MTFSIILRLFVLFLIVAAPASAQVYSLSPTEKFAAIDSASRRPDADNPALLPALTADRRAHGEVGAIIGTGGARGIYGVVGVPLGENGSAVLAFSNVRNPRFYGNGPFDAASQSFGMRLQQQGW